MDEGINEDFTGGDNNDGITIIDTLTNKYCFMNIYYKSDEIGECISDLEPLIAYTARDYVTAYYPENVNLLSDYTKQRATKNKKTFESIVKANISGNKAYVNRFKTFGILTANEIAVMFPKLKDKLVK